MPKTGGYDRYFETLPNPMSYTCFCIGPQDGEPLCPCRMRTSSIFKRKGRWIRPEQDIGPVTPWGTDLDA